MRYLAPFALFFFVLFSAVAQAQFELPHADTPEQEKALRAQIAEEAPWYTVYGGAEHLTTMVNASKKLVPWLEADKTWQQLLATRTPRQTIAVSTAKEAYKQARTVRPNVAAMWVNGIGEMFVLASKSFGDDKSAIFKLAAQEVEWVSAHDARALITGLINSIPGLDKAKFFKMGSPSEQIAALEKESAFTDENLKKNFRAQAFGLEAEDITKVKLTGMVHESLTREAQLPHILRAAWARMTLSPAELGNLKNVEPLKLDVFSQTPEGLKKLFERIGLGAKSIAFVQKQAKAYVNEEDYVIDRVKVMVPDQTYIVEEVSPTIGATRGCLMYDCSLQAFGFAYTPTEYVFVVRDAKGKPEGFMAVTRVKGNDGDIFYVHDFGAQGLKSTVIDIAMRGLYMNMENFNVKHITITAKNGNNGDWGGWVARHSQRGAKQLDQAYYDSEIRAHIYAATAYFADYDLGTTAANHRAVEYVPESTQGYMIQVTFTGEGGASMPEELSNSELLLKALGILTADPGAGLSAEMRAVGMHPGELNELLSVLANEEKRTLAEYYASLKDYFAKYDINMSRNFIRDHEYIFQKGHLNASDAVTAEDAALKNQTVRYLVFALKHTDKLEPLFEIVRANLDYFKANETFSRYIKSFSGHGEHEPETLEAFLAMGFDFDYILKDKEASALFLASQSSLIRLWILESWKPAQLKALPVEIVRMVAEDLGADDDHIPSRASKILLHTNNDDEKVMKELKRSGKDEEVMEIAMRTAVAFYAAGGESDSLAKRVRKYEGSQEWDADLRKRLDDLLAKLPPPKEKEKPEDQENCEDAVAGVRPVRRARAG